MKKWLAMILAVCMLLLGTACSQETAPTDPLETVPAGAPVKDAGELTILYTNDTRGNARTDGEKGITGYAGLAAYRDKLAGQGKQVVLVDGGGSLYGSGFALVSRGGDVVSLMNETGYAVAVPGWEDLLYGVEWLSQLQQQMGFSWLCCNLLDRQTGECVFEPYKILTFGEEKVAFVGILSPGAEKWLLPPAFSEKYSLCLDENGESLYRQVQKTIDQALEAGADTVICVGSTGIDPEQAPWTAPRIVANTTGMAVYLAGHSLYPVENALLEDSKGNPVTLVCSGVGFGSFGEVNLELDGGKAEGKLIYGAEEEKPAIAAYAQSLLSAYREGGDAVTLNLCDLRGDGTGEKETPLGRFCSDAVRYAMDTDAALLPGKAILAGLPTGSLGAGDLLDVFSETVRVCVVEATGQEILDALEYACRDAEQEGYQGWLQVSGIAYTLDLSIPSGVRTDENGALLEIRGQRRVKDVTLQGQPLDPAKTYRLAGTEDMLCYGGGGYALFADNRVLTYPLMTGQDALWRYAGSMEEISVLDYSEFWGNRVTLQQAETE